MPDVCDNCDLDALIDNCARCGAPVCCSHCCQVDALTKRIAELESLLSDAKESNLQRQVRLAQESSKHRPWWLQVHGR